VRRISTLDHEGIIAYNLRDGGTQATVFADSQSARVERARNFVARLAGYVGTARIIELGCSAGDISGPFAEQHSVLGVDVTPRAAELARERWPAMEVRLAKAEDLVPEPCDILVLCEFLEHITDPFVLVAAWLPLARYAVIGHPLNDPGIEPGHIWSYTLDDYFGWLDAGGHRRIETHLFSGPFPEMVMGISER
jgi:hypothetical protein